MTEQLRFEGDPSFEEHPFTRLIKELYLEPLKQAMMSKSTLLFGDWKPPGPKHEVQTLFGYNPQCTICSNFGDELLICNLDSGHSGPHYDGYNGLEWSPRGNSES